MTAPDGHFRFRMKPNAQYRLEVGRKGMLTQSRDVSTVGVSSSLTLHEDFQMLALDMERSFVLNNIYFDSESWNIRPDAAEELDKLARLINDNPELSFELGSHSDSRASDEYNLVLSDMRASSTVDYLIRHGVDPNRLSSRGYGEQKLTNRCANGVLCTEEEHQQNRRTEFKVVKVRELASTPR